MNSSRQTSNKNSIPEHFDKLKCKQDILFAEMASQTSLDIAL